MPGEAGRGRRGVFVTIEGASGTGKTTLAAELARQLANAGVPVLLTAEPTRSPLGRMARNGTLAYRGLVLACLVAADRYHHLTTQIRPRLLAGDIVISDRYILSSLVLQQLDGVPLDYIKALNAHAENPDLAILLEGTPALSWERAQRRGNYSRLHNADLGSAVREADVFRRVATEMLASGYPIECVSVGARAPGELAEALCLRVTALLEAGRAGSAQR